MVKLIRFATNNNGVFKSSFGSSIDIKPNAKIALLNLTFETEFEQLVITGKNRNITFQSDIGNGATLISAQLPLGTYNRGELPTLYSDIQNTLNSCLSQVAWPETNSIYSGFLVTTNNTDGKLQIEYRYAPLMSWLSAGSWNISGPMQFMLKSTNPTFTTTGLPGQNEEIVATQTTAAVATAVNWIAALPTCKLNNGNAIFTARCNDVNDNGSGLQDNGFAIGLSLTPLGAELVDGNDIPIADRYYEIRVNRPGETYKTITAGAAEVDSLIQPAQIDITTYADINTHDILCFEKSGGKLHAVIYQQTLAPATAVRVLLFSVSIDPGYDYYPYMFINGVQANCVIDMVNFTVDPWINNGNIGWKNTGGHQGSSIGSDIGWQNRWLALKQSGVGPATGAGAGTGVIPFERLTKWGQGGAQDPIYDTSLIMDADIWKVLGFANQGAGNGPYDDQTVSLSNELLGKYWSWWRASDLASINQSDNFMVISDTLQLDSYDASAVHYSNIDADVLLSNDTDKQGRRKNILMTIPVNDNADADPIFGAVATTGIVEFQTNTPIFININNDAPMNLRNLNFRVLRKDFTPIVQSSELAIMTILIED